MNFILRPLLQLYRCEALLPISLGFGAFLLVAGPFVLFPGFHMSTGFSNSPFLDAVRNAGVRWKLKA